MEDFKRIVKMKTGGSVSKAIAAYEKRERKGEESADVAQDKKIVKKAFAMHDKQEHPGEKTDLSKLKKGGRAKKEAGTVRKYKTGGTVENAYAAKKTSKDIADIANTKRQKPQKLCGGKSVRKYEEGGSIIDKGVDAVKSFGKSIYENVMGTPEQNRKAQESMDRQAKAGSKLAKFFGGKADAESAPVEKCSGGKMRKGGKVCQ